MSGAIGKVQISKLPDFIDARRRNAELFVSLFEDHPYLSIQKEVGLSSWFGFSFIVKKNSSITRQLVLNKLDKIGVEYRPIVTGNFARQPVIKYLNCDVSQELTNADYLDRNGFFIGNHHYDISEQPASFDLSCHDRNNYVLMPIYRSKLNHLTILLNQFKIICSYKVNMHFKWYAKP